jgi:hypothetical protein
MNVVLRPVVAGLVCLLSSGAIVACSSGKAGPGATLRGTGGSGNDGSAGSLIVGTSGAGSSGLAVSDGGSSATTADCGSGPATSISGTVYDPAGQVPLYNIVLFVPGAALDPISTGAACQTCDGDYSGKPQAVALSDAKGHFEIDNAPSGDNVPLVIQVGKWRREVTIPHVAPCMDNPIMDKDMTRLPRNHTEGDIPHMAIALGGSDSLECLIRRIGVDDSEFTTPDLDGRVHLYRWAENAAMTMQENGNGASATVPSADTLWSNLDSLMKYDMMLMSCTGESKLGASDQDSETGTDPLWYPQVVKFSEGAHGITNPLTAQIDTSFPKGQSFSDWLTNVGASTTPGQIVVQGAEHTIDSVLPQAILSPDTPTYAMGPGAQQWIYATDPTSASKPTQTVQYFSMNTPVGGAECGRMVFSDLHVATGSGDTTKVPFPTGCSTTPLTPQEKALEFMLFDLSSCVQSDQDPPVPPVVVK